MAQSLAINWVHLVFSTKDRWACLTPQIQPGLFAYQAGILQELDCYVSQIGGHTDHVHMLFTLSKNYALKKIVEEVKTGSSKWLKTQRADLSKFYWQGGYGAFSVSPAQCGRVRDYTMNQDAHHRTKTFKDEFRLMLKRAGLEYDERYVWD